jgi:hypothetical protein
VGFNHGSLGSLSWCLKRGMLFVRVYGWVFGDVEVGGQLIGSGLGVVDL